jgi:multiple sugar transport system permease protein
MMVSSIKTEATLYSVPPELLPYEISFRSYQKILLQDNFYLYVWNTTYIALVSTALTLIFSIFGGYSLARFQFKGRNFLSRIILLIYMFPPILLLVPLYIFEANFHLVNTHIGLIITYVAFRIPFVLWLLKGFFTNIPVDMEESAMIDGCSRLGAFWKVILPLSLPALFAGAIFVFIGTWSEYLYALVWLGEETLKTMVINIAEELYTHFQIFYGEILAFGTIMCLPIFIFSWFVQRYIVEGLTAGAVKG